MSAKERLAEVARLLAAGFLRLHACTVASPPTPVQQRAFRLDFSPAESGRCELQEQGWEAEE